MGQEEKGEAGNALLQRQVLPVRAQGTMHVPVALQQDLGVPYLFHVQCKGMGQEDPVVLLLVLPVWR